MTKFTKNVKWLEPYYEDSKHLLGPHRLDRVMGFKVSPKKEARTDASIIIQSAGNVTITIRTHSNFKRQSTPRNIGSLLLAFAHELAHLKYWDHCEKHWQLQCYLMQNFTSTMRILGITNHEADASED